VSHHRKESKQFLSNMSNSNCSSESYPFYIKFRGIDEPFTAELNDTLTSLRSLKNKIQLMYQTKYAKQIKIHKIGYYEPYMSLECDIQNFDDATHKYEIELKSDEDVEHMFNTCLIDPKYPRMYATLIA
jgi:hypothetical protein